MPFNYSLYMPCPLCCFSPSLFLGPLLSFEYFIWVQCSVNHLMYKYLPDYDYFLVKAKCGHKLMSKSNENGIWQDAAAGPSPSLSPSPSPSLSHSRDFSLEPKSRHKFAAAKKWQKCVYWPNAQQLIDYEAVTEAETWLQMERGWRGQRRRKGGAQWQLPWPLRLAALQLLVACLLGKVVAAHMSYT